MENHHFSWENHGKSMSIHYFNWAIFKFANGPNVSQRVKPQKPVPWQTHLTHLGPLDRPTWRCFAPG